MAFAIPVVDHWMEWEIAQWVQHERLIRQHIADEWTLHFTEYISVERRKEMFCLTTYSTIIWRRTYG